MAKADIAALQKEELPNTSKSSSAFRTISEVSDEVEVPQHVLRFWETKFSQIRPLKRGGGRRYYRPEDVNIICGIRDLLYRDGYTIKGVQKLLKEKGDKSFLTEKEPPPKKIKKSAPKDNNKSVSSSISNSLTDSVRKELQNIVSDLTEMHNTLNNLSENK